MSQHQIPPSPVEEKVPLSVPQKLASYYINRSKSGRWATRILILEPGTFDSGLVAKLVTTYIVHFSGVIVPDSQQRIEYVALSYTWGLADFRRYIRINGVEFPITDNLYAFLQRYRCRYARRHLWIDALCINQMDPSEKAAQIGNMLYIFGKASEVVVWLGDHGPHSKVAIMYLKWLEGFFLKKTHVARWNWEEKMGPYHARKCFMLSIRALAGLKDICSRQWPTRIWIRQEVWAARSVSVMCGSTYFTWRQYLMAALTTLHEEHSTQVYTIGISPRQAQLLESLQILRDTADDIEDRHQVQQAPGPDRNRKYDMETLINLLNNSTLCQSTIPHDRIFSLLGMAPMLKQRVGSTRRLTSSLTALFASPSRRSLLALRRR
ncbi:heterokaryon incompatibility protein-domain-containing protein [Xylariomycetidae sp. FL2044]|nr:heterokaryon incompatibility protein-domain-containing protein [Xylariomycetidae sp. FL2044]